MPEPGLVVLLDQNVPRATKDWLTDIRPLWTVMHVSDLDMAQASDLDIFQWAVTHRAVVVTFDEDFADRRGFTITPNVGVVRLRVWPTTQEETTNALRRLLAEVSESRLLGSTVVVGRRSIRVRPADEAGIDV